MVDAEGEEKVDAEDEEKVDAEEEENAMRCERGASGCA
jgi:hypothetical protein